MSTFTLSGLFVFALKNSANSLLGTKPASDVDSDTVHWRTSNQMPLVHTSESSHPFCNDVICYLSLPSERNFSSVRLRIKSTGRDFKFH